MLSYTFALCSEGGVLVNVYPPIPSLEWSSQFRPAVDVRGLIHRKWGTDAYSSVNGTQVQAPVQCLWAIIGLYTWIGKKLTQGANIMAVGIPASDTHPTRLLPVLARSSPRPR
jgi:hypothetical protein